MPKQEVNKFIRRDPLWLMLVVGLILFSACSSPEKTRVDELNDIAYSYHYRNLDSARVFAKMAYSLAGKYDDGRAEALNNLAFVMTMKMEYERADSTLREVLDITDNQIELVVADIQLMRLCQRKSDNKEFYDHFEEAQRRFRRISEERGVISERSKRRLAYATSEMAIVSSTYYYYVGLGDESVEELRKIDEDDLLTQDTAQYLNYLYNIGAGGVIRANTAEETAQIELDHLMRCCQLASRYDYPFWEANSLEAMAEHFMIPEGRKELVNNNLPALTFLGVQNLPDSLIAGTLASQSVDIFSRYGDVYQIAGSYRTLASCYFNIGDYSSCIDNLQTALNRNTTINKAPDLVASIREQLSVAYAGVNDKQQSDYNRNEYLDLQISTRQDRFWESRAEQFRRSSNQLNIMLAAVVAAILLLSILLLRFYRLRRNDHSEEELSELMQPLKEWEKQNQEKQQDLADRYEDISEETQLNEIHILNNRKQNLENRAKISLVLSVTPFIDRIAHEVSRLKDTSEDGKVREERFKYVDELTDKINEYNGVLTSWIQLRQGQISLHIESFPLQQIFDTVGHGKMSFSLKGIELEVIPTTATVKADRILTLFMINTLADNARKFTPEGGKVAVSARELDDAVEISVADTGCGIEEDKLKDIFNHKVYGGHGFGLMNCKGIIEKYRKISQIFSVCSINAESRKGHGSRFFFRLPKGIQRAILFLLMIIPNIALAQNEKAGMYADSAYYSNLNGTYERTLEFADSCEKYIVDDKSNDYYEIAADFHNEAAVAALALHKWPLYRHHNDLYTQLYKEGSSDSTLGDYCRMMQKSETNKTIAIAILFVLLLSILPAYYFLYYRHRLYYRFCLEKVNKINAILLDDTEPTEKLGLIENMAGESFPQELKNIVSAIITSLRTSISLQNEQNEHIQLAEDEKRRAELEDNQLHISNSVLDNCLSTLKHETMYYPSRIHQLVETDRNNLQAIEEVVAYYKELYLILTKQAVAQTENARYHISNIDVEGHTVTGDKDMIKYLFDILKKENNNEQPKTVVTGREHYVEIRVLMNNLRLSGEEAKELFTPAKERIPYLLCRQIVRDHGEFTNRRGCGIMAQLDENNNTEIIITLPGK